MSTPAPYSVGIAANDMNYTPLGVALAVKHSCPCGATFSIELSLHSVPLVDKVFAAEEVWRQTHNECQIQEDSALVQAMLAEAEVEGGLSPDDFGDEDEPADYRISSAQLNGLIKEASQQQNPRWSDDDLIPADDTDA